MPERTYTEDEVAAIFAGAAERQRPPSVRDPSAGLTLAEIEQAGVEAGLDAHAIRAAAADMDGRPPFPARPTVAVAERWIEGSLPVGAWEDVVAALRNQFGTSSVWWNKDTTQLGDAQEWTHTGSSGVRTTVTLSPRDENALLRVMQEETFVLNDRLAGWSLALALSVIPALVAGALVAGALALGNFAGVTAVAAVLLLAVGLGGPPITARLRKRREGRAGRAQQVADDLAVQINGMRSHVGSDDVGLGPSPQLDLTGLDAESPEAPRKAQDRRLRS